MFGQINVLCNNAGVGGGGNAEDPDFDAWDRAMDPVELGAMVVMGIMKNSPYIITHA